MTTGIIYVIILFPQRQDPPGSSPQPHRVPAPQEKGEPLAAAVPGQAGQSPGSAPEQPPPLSLTEVPEPFGALTLSHPLQDQLEHPLALGEFEASTESLDRRA